jgi:RNA polymerase sigma-70 factor (ECF subfamily)
MLFIFFIESGTDSGKIPRSTAEVFAEFYEQYMPKIFSYISYRVTDKHVAEDLTSSVFEKALTKFNTFDAKKAAFSTWVFTIARNTVIDYYRDNSKKKEIESDTAVFITTQYTSTEDEVVKAEDFKKLKTCLSKLNKHEQEIISLKFSSELTNRKIAQMLGMTESNVGIILFRAIRKLRDGFGKFENEPGI